MTRIGRLVSAAIVLGVTLGLAGCTAGVPLLGLTVIDGRTAIVVSLCPGERISEVSTYHGDASGNNVTTTWEMKANPPRPGVLFIIGMPHPGFTTTIPLASTLRPSDENASVTVDSPSFHGVYEAAVFDDFVKAKAGSVLVNGSYITYGKYMSDYALCKQRKKDSG
jgi:hypothetical protein